MTNHCFTGGYVQGYFLDQLPGNQRWLQEVSGESKSEKVALK